MIRFAEYKCLDYTEMKIADISNMSSVKDKSKEKSKKSRDPSSQQEKNKGLSEASLDANHILSTLKDKAKKSQKLPVPQTGVPKGWRKATFLIRDEHHEKLKEISHWERIHIKDILAEVLERFFSSVKAKS